MVNEQASKEPAELPPRGNVERMASKLESAWKVAQAIFGIADVSRRVLNPGASVREQPGSDLEAAGGGLLGHVEARLTGVMISALKEAFDRDAARLDAERAALDDQRRRADEALRLELVRQAADRALTRLRSVGVLALTIWIVSVLFAMQLPGSFAGAARIVLACGWAALLGAMGASFAAHGQVSRWVGTAQATRASAADLTESAPSLAAPWLVLAGLALVGGSFLLAL
jgi:hypothetical protein